MPTYKKGEVTITKPPQDFIDRVAREELAEARVAKMKLNLSHQEYKEMFDQYNRMKQESEQRLQRLSLKQYYQQNRQQIIPTGSSNTNTNTSNSSNVLKHFKLMKRITGT